MTPQPYNPAQQPSSVGALLGEEYSVLSSSALPSFLETVFVEETSRSMRGDAIGTALDAFVSFAEAEAASASAAAAAAESGDHDRDDQGDEPSTSRVPLPLPLPLHLLLQKLHKKIVVVPAGTFVRRYKLEIQYLAIAYLLERYVFLARYSAFASESAYGTKRVRISLLPSSASPTTTSSTTSSTASSGNSTGRRRGKLSELSDSDKTRAALLAVLAPYLRAKLDKYCYDDQERNQQQRQQQQQQQQQQRDDVSTSTSSSTLLQRLLHLLDANKWTCCYSAIRTALYAVDFSYRWRYLTGRSVFFSLRDRLLGQVVRRTALSDFEDSDGNDKDANNTSANATSDTANAPTGTDTGAHSSTTPAAMTTTTTTTRGLVLYAVAASIAVSWLAQIRRDWNDAVDEARRRTSRRRRRSGQSRDNSDSRGRIHERNQQQQQQHSQQHSQPHWYEDDAADSVPPPPPPPPSSSSLPSVGRGGSGSGSGGDRGCPLCSRTPRKYPTATPYGHVFCYACIVAYVRENGTCPVTGEDLCRDASRLVRLFEPSPSGSGNAPAGA